MHKHMILTILNSTRNAAVMKLFISSAVVDSAYYSQCDVKQTNVVAIATHSPGMRRARRNGRPLSGRRPAVADENLNTIIMTSAVRRDGHVVRRDGHVGWVRRSSVFAIY